MPTTVVGATSICLAVGTNYLFIYGTGGWGGLGFVGSPLSTVFASWFQPLSLFLYAFVYKKYHLRAWCGWNWHTLTLCRFKAFVTISGPISGNSFVSNLANALVSLVAAKLGAETIAANAVISGMWGMLWALFWGYGCATQVRVANYLGAGEPQRAQKVAKLGFLCTAVVVSLLAFVTNQFDRDVIAIYTTDEKLLRACRQVLPIFICAYVIESFEILCGGVLTGMRYVVSLGSHSLAGGLTSLCARHGQPGEGELPHEHHCHMVHQPSRGVHRRHCAGLWVPSALGRCAGHGGLQAHDLRRLSLARELGCHGQARHGGHGGHARADARRGRE